VAVVLFGAVAAGLFAGGTGTVAAPPWPVPWADAGAAAAPNNRAVASRPRIVVVVVILVSPTGLDPSGRLAAGDVLASATSR
jgi:hypothetical protein